MTNNGLATEQIPGTTTFSEQPASGNFFSRLMQRKPVTTTDNRKSTSSVTTIFRPAPSSTSSISSTAPSSDTASQPTTIIQPTSFYPLEDETVSKVARMVEENKQLHRRVEELTVQAQLNQDMLHKCSQILSDKDTEIAALEHLKIKQEEIIVELNDRFRTLTLRDKKDSGSSQDARVEDLELTAQLSKDKTCDERSATDTIVEQELPGYDAILQSPDRDEAAQDSLETQSVHAGQDSADHNASMTTRGSDAKPKHVVCAPTSGPNAKVPCTAGSVREAAYEDRGQSSLPSSFKRGKDWEGMTWLLS